MRISALIFSFLSALILVGSSQSQDTSNPYLARMEHQTREEDVCMLVQKDGRYHLERTAMGRARVFEGTLPSSAVTELEPLLTAGHLAELLQNQIESAPAGGDIDQVMLTISRAKGWQTLTFASAKARKPFKEDIDPILKWLDRNKQQPTPTPDATTNRCVPQQGAQVAGGKPSASNPYIMRIVVERYELKGGGTAMSSVSAAKGTTGQNIGGMTNTDAMDVNSYRITRTCAIVYDSGRYREERNVRESGIVTKSEVYRDTIDKAQLTELRQMLDNPKLAALPNNVGPGFFAREGEVTTLGVPRDKSVQGVVVATFAPRPASADLREAAYSALSEHSGLMKPIRKWLKENVEDHKSDMLKDVPANNCAPSPQPE